MDVPAAEQGVFSRLSHAAAQETQVVYLCLFGEDTGRC